MSKNLTPQEALALLNESNATSRSGGRVKIDPTAIRDFPSWFKLSHTIREEGCENPDCTDTRPKSRRMLKDENGNIVLDENNNPVLVERDKAANTVALVKGKYMCRICFLAGWLS